MKMWCAAMITALAVVASGAGEPDGLTLPPGFHATVVAENLGPVRHLAVRSNGDIYASTPRDAQGKGGGIVAIRLDGSHRRDQVEHFGTVDGGTGIRFYRGALYASAPSGVYRFSFTGNDLVPHSDGVAVVQGTPDTHPGFNRTNRPIAFDGKGNLFIALDASANLCTDPLIPLGGAAAAPPTGLRPCPDLSARAGIWRFNADKIGQRFPTDGEQWATGIRDMTSLDWSPADGHLYGIMHGRDSSNRFWPRVVSADDEDAIADEMHQVVKGTNFGWPYTYYDGVRRLRLVAPEYGGDGKSSPSDGTYSTPALTFQSRRPAPVDLMFYTGNRLPAPYRGGAFVVLHGTSNRTGYNVSFVPFANGKPGTPVVFADGFAAFDTRAEGGVRARYRPMGIAEGPDGSLYVADSQQGRLWRIMYTSPSTLN
jgi:glucose/arabinose dehydrogenase